ncbi:MAG TPA: FtsX-like permease family protein [Solirubrobacteraceae bacterium]
MRPANILRLYRVRLRARLMQECLAVLGIAAGVALLFASQVASTSLQSSVGALARGIAGHATLQLLARDQRGLPADMLGQVRQIPGVHVAAPILEASANAVGPAGSASVEIIGADASLARLGGSLASNPQLTPFAGFGTIVLPAPLAAKVGVTRFGQKIAFQIAGRTVTAPLYTQLHAKQIGSLSESPIVLATLSFAQRLAGLQRRVSAILVQPAAGAQARVRTALRRLAGDRYDVEPTGYAQTLFDKAAAASNQSTALFAAISALVGFLFAFNAMLLTVPQRRRLVVDLRRDGYTPATVIAVLLLDALALGLIASTLGLALGDELSIHLFHPNTAFLSLAFSLGSQRSVSWQEVAIAGTGGMLAAIVAVLSPLRDILSRDPLAVINNSRRPAARATFAQGRCALAGLALLIGASAILLAAPQASIAGMVLLVGALLLELPIVLGATLKLVRRLARTLTSPVGHLATMELDAAGARALAIAATGAVAVFGSVAIQGAHRDLLAGLDTAASEMNASASVWVAPAGSYNLLMTTPFPALERAKLEGLRGVRAVRLYRGGLLDYGQRRVLVLAPPRSARPLLPAGQLVEGDTGAAIERVRKGGWVVLSQALAAEHHLQIGDAFTLPSPQPQRFRVAALSTNVGWAPGAILMNASDYARAWGSGQASAYGILLDRSMPASRGAEEIARALGPPAQSGLTVETSAQHTRRQQALSHRALARLTQITILIPLIAVLAMAAAIGAMVWQRRPRLARLKLDGIARASLWRVVLLESLLLLGAGCLTGAVFGLYAQQLADRALASAVNFPVAGSVIALGGLQTLGLVIAAALALLMIPCYLAARAPAALALQD